MSTEDYAEITIRVLVYFFCSGFIKWAHTGVVMKTIMFCHISYQKVFNRLHFNLDTRVYTKICTFFCHQFSTILTLCEIKINPSKKQLTIEMSNWSLKTFLCGAELIGLNKVSLDLQAHLTRDLSVQSIKGITISQRMPCIHLDPT